MNKAIRWGILMLAIVAIIANAIIAWTPTSNIDGKNFYTIFNFSNVSASKLFDSGNRVLTNQTILNVNSSVWWDNENSQSNLNVNKSVYWDEETSQANLNVNSSHFWAELAATTEITALGTISTGLWQATQIADAYLAALNANKLTNIPYLNYKILSYWVNITDRPGYLSNFTDDIDYSTKNVNRSTFWGIFSGASDLNDKVLSKWENITNRPTYLSNFTDNLDYSGKNVNSSQYWKELSVPSDLNGRILVYWINITDRPTALSFFTDDLGARGYTLLSNFTDDLGARGYTLLSNFTDDLVYSNKNVNSSVYWGTLQNPSDLNGRVLIYWANISDAPTTLSFFTDDLGARGYTLLSNFTDNLGARGYTLLSNFTDDIDYSSKNVNRSDYWDIYNVPTDLNNKLTLACQNITGSAGNICLNQTLNANNYADSLLITDIFNASAINTITGTPQGTLYNIQVYDGIPYNVSEVNSDIDFRVNFTGITNFNQIIVRYKSDAAESHTMDIALWDNTTLSWESYRAVGVAPDYNIITMNVYDVDHHIVDGGVVQVRFYSNNVGALTHKHYFDWVAISDGPATPSSSETDPYSIHKDGNVELTGNWNAGSYNITAPGFNGYLNGTAKNATGWDGISSQSEITHTGNLSSLNVTGNVTAPWFNGQILWEFIADKFITAVGSFFYVDSGTLQVNTTVLNATIDGRVAVASNLSVAGGIKLDGTTFSVEAGTGLVQETNGLAVAYAELNNSHLRYKTGQNLTINDNPEFENLTVDGTLNPAKNLTFGKGYIIPQGEYGCFDASCNHYIFENSTGVLIIV